MKKNTLQKVLATALVGAMAMGTLSGCGSDPASASTTSTTSEAAPSTQESEPASADASTEEVKAEGGGIETWEAFAENVTLRVPVYDRGAEGVPNVSDNYWTKWIQENFGDKYNVTVEFVPITRTDVMTDYSLLAASKNLPTILMEYDYPKVAQWSADGYLTTFDMNEFAKVAPTYYNRMVENEQIGYSKMNGETYFALAYRPYYNTGYTFQTFVRMDWLKQVGYDHVPETRAEYVDAMKKIQDAGLSKNPKGGAMVTGVGSDQNYAYRSFPLDEADWAAWGDVNIPALGHEANKKLLKIENEDYNLGFTNPEYYVTDEETKKAAFVNGDTYEYAGYIAPEMDWLNAFYKNNPDAELAIKPAGVEDPDNGTVPAWRADNPFGMIVGFSSQATDDQLKAAWMYMEWMTQEDVLFTMQWGIEGENYTIDPETNLPVAVSDYEGDYKQGFSNSKDYWCVTIEARNAGTVEEIIAANSPKGLPQDFTDDIIDFYNKRVEYSKKGYAVNDAIFAVTIEAQNDNQQALVDLYKEYRDQLTMCKPEEFDALYDELAQKFLDAGFQAVVDERLAAYEAGNSTKLPE